jgi:hypothetical protein
MSDFAFYVGLVEQALKDDTTIAWAVDNIFQAAPGEPVSNDMLEELQACISIATQALTPQPLAGVASHGNSTILQQISFMVTVAYIEGRDSNSYASWIAGLIFDKFKGDYVQKMNNINYQIVFRPASWKIATLPESEFSGNRSSAKVTAEIKYFG